MHLFALLILGLSVAGTPEGSISDYSTQVSRISESRVIEPRDKAASIYKIYIDHVAGMRRDKSSLSDDDLHKLFTVTGAAFFYSQFSQAQDSRMLLRNLSSVFDELERRGIGTQSELAEVHQGLISARAFDDAKAASERHPGSDLIEVPPYTQASGFDAKLPAVFSLADDGKSLYLHNVDATHGRFILVVAQCHYARDAALQISKDPELAKAFSEGRALWLQSSYEPLSASDLKAWNEFFPEQPLSIAFDDKVWRDIDFSLSPGFFFFEDGKLVSRRDGWSETASRSRLRESLRQIGLLGPES